MNIYASQPSSGSEPLPDAPFFIPARYEEGKMVFTTPEPNSNTVTVSGSSVNGAKGKLDLRSQMQRLLQSKGAERKKYAGKIFLLALLKLLYNGCKLYPTVCLLCMCKKPISNFQCISISISSWKPLVSWICKSDISVLIVIHIALSSVYGI